MNIIPFNDYASGLEEENRRLQARLKRRNAPRPCGKCKWWGTEVARKSTVLGQNFHFCQHKNMPSLLLARTTDFGCKYWVRKKD